MSKALNSELRCGIIGKRIEELTKTALASFSDSPTYLSKISLGWTRTIGMPNSLARARQTIVFPVPGGPYRSIPDNASWARTPMLNWRGWSKGSEMIDRRVSITLGSMTTSRKPVFCRFSGIFVIWLKRSRERETYQVAQCAK